ncbi:type I-F CRISPR-associated protein Csy2 [Massilia sp. W12]|uniref:type I-F CRISPR-associated protein Csy2 n=1 Tax=Massilia sp. W12 TaxID=3126507 RepID=UPI0030CEFD12
MRSVLILRHLQVENANAVTGLTWGFPAITHFTGFTHALSRKLFAAQGVRLGGCAVICHQHQVNVLKPAAKGDYSLVQSRHPLTKEGKTAPIIEEGKMHCTVSLMIECEFGSGQVDFDKYDDEQNHLGLLNWFKQTVPSLRLAGGLIVGMDAREPVFFSDMPDGEQERAKFRRQVIKRLLPGFALVSRHDLLQAHWADLQQTRPDAELLDAWLDFCTLQYDAPASPDQDGAYLWARRPKPGPGWLAPLAIGYRAISPLYPAGQVKDTRDTVTSFRFVESAYSIGQWLSPHRIQDLRQLLWQHKHEGDFYLCHNSYQTFSADDDDDEDDD